MKKKELAETIAVLRNKIDMVHTQNWAVSLVARVRNIEGRLETLETFINVQEQATEAKSETNEPSTLAEYLSRNPVTANNAQAAYECEPRCKIGDRCPDSTSPWEAGDITKCTYCREEIELSENDPLPLCPAKMAEALGLEW